MAAARARWNRLDGLVISVGGPPPTSALTATDDEWEGSFRAVFLGAVRLIRAAVPAMSAEVPSRSSFRRR